MVYNISVCKLALIHGGLIFVLMLVQYMVFCMSEYFIQQPFEFLYKIYLWLFKIITAPQMEKSQRNQSVLPLWCTQNHKGHGSQLKEHYSWSFMVYVVFLFCEPNTLLEEIKQWLECKWAKSACPAIKKSLS